MEKEPGNPRLVILWGRSPDRQVEGPLGPLRAWEGAECVRAAYRPWEFQRTPNAGVADTPEGAPGAPSMMIGPWCGGRGRGAGPEPVRQSRATELGAVGARREGVWEVRWTSECLSARRWSRNGRSVG